MESLAYWGVGLLALSIVMLLIEVFVPTAGVLGVAAVCVGLAGVVCLFRFDWRWGMCGLLAMGVIGPTIVIVGLQVFPSTPIGKRIMNLPPGADPEDGAPPAGQSEFEALIDREGDAVTDLRPGGFVRIDSKRVAAMSEVSFVAAGSKVRVTGADGMQVRVRPV